uniref:Uncharacterized protein n=1 Tax=Cacopsylla melanoneura TaxID=428564 RepID=A0A8D8WCI0_9HEMI
MLHSFEPTKFSTFCRQLFLFARIFFFRLLRTMFRFCEFSSLCGPIFLIFRFCRIAILFSTIFLFCVFRFCRFAIWFGTIFLFSVFRFCRFVIFFDRTRWSLSRFRLFPLNRQFNTFWLSWVFGIVDGPAVENLLYKSRTLECQVRIVTLGFGPYEGFSKEHHFKQLAKR